MFGHVIEGQDVVREIERQKVDENSCPLSEVKISSCGELVLQVRPKGMTAVCKFTLDPGNVDITLGNICLYTTFLCYTIEHSKFILHRLPDLCKVQ